MARSNFSFQKRQKELERKKKQEEKRQRRLAKKAAKSGEAPNDTDGVDQPEPASPENANPDSND